MVSRAFPFVLGLLFTAGCVHPQGKCPTVNHAIAPFEQYIARNFDWSSVQRVVLLPVANQTAFPRVSYEIQTNLAAEIQRAGRFEIVVAKREDMAMRAQDVFASGQFNEIELLRVAREYQADAVLFANVTNYHPYARPRIGLSTLMVSPAEAIAIATINGLWDTREAGTSFQAQAYFRQTQNWPRSLLGSERVFESPDVFQRFVCQQVAVSLSPIPPNATNGMPITDGMQNPSGIQNLNGMPNANGMPASPPAETVMPMDSSTSDGMNLPPTPPASAETQQ